MLLKCLSILLATTVLAEVPSYIKVCGRRNPDLSGCVRNTVEQLRGKLQTGIPEFDVPSVEPLALKGFPLIETEHLKTYVKNVKLFGLSKFEIKSLNINLESKQITMELVLDSIAIDADYDVTARLLVPIQGHGPIHITSKDIIAGVTMQYKVHTKNGKEYLFFTGMKTKLTVKDYTSQFKPVDSPSGASGATLRVAIEAALSGGHHEILKIITPNLEKVISEEVLQLANKICQRFTLDELLPDRE